MILPPYSSIRRKNSIYIYKRDLTKSVGLICDTDEKDGLMPITVVGSNPKPVKSINYIDFTISASARKLFGEMPSCVHVL